MQSTSFRCISHFSRFEREILEDALFLNRELLVKRVVEAVDGRKIRETRERLMYLEDRWDNRKLTFTENDYYMFQVALKHCRLFTDGLHKEHKHHWHYLTAKQNLKFTYKVKIPL